MAQKVSTHWPLAEWQRKLEGASQRFVELFVRGDFSLELYAPRSEDLQTPHSRDEVYIIASGSGTFEREGERTAFTTGDVLFVAAREKHRFVEFTEDFSTWVMFFGESHQGLSFRRRSRRNLSFVHKKSKDGFLRSATE